MLDTCFDLVVSSESEKRGYISDSSQWLVREKRIIAGNIRLEISKEE